MFHPMAFTVVIALLGAMILSITFIPAAVALFIGERVAEKENFLMRGARRGYAPLLDRAIAARAVVLTIALVAVILSGLLATRLGSEFVPSLNEGDFAIQALRIPGTSLTQSVAMQQQLESTLVAKFPEIERVFARTGTAEIASDPMPPNISDGYVMLKPVDQWPEPRQHARAVDRQRCRTRSPSCPATATSSRNRSSLRFNELISGVRSDVAVKMFGDDMDVLSRPGNQIAQALQRMQRRGRGQGRADDRPADAHRQHRPGESRRATA